MTAKRPWTAGKMIIRNRSDAITSGFEIGINKEHFPFGVSAPADPFMLGKCVAVVASEADARLFAGAPALYEALHNSLIIIMAQYEAGLKTDAPDELLRHLASSISDTTTALRAANPDAFESAEGEGE